MNFQISNPNQKTQLKKQTRNQLQLQSDQNKHLKFGLNNRTSKSSSSALKASSKKKSIFQDNDSSSSDDENTARSNSARNRCAMNLKINEEQSNVRNKIQQNNELLHYDYDEDYEKYSHETQKQKREEQKRTEKKSSRYVSTLLKAAEERKMEQDILYERKVAREQKEEDGDEAFEDKEKFITSAYKRKLQERNQWEEKEKIRNKQEEEEDVRKKGVGSAFIGFYGNLHNGVCNEEEILEAKNPLDQKEAEKLRNIEVAVQERNGGSSTFSTNRKIEDKIEEIKEVKEVKLTREEKLAEARKRYFERHPEQLVT